jgi:hypothetical protein
VLSNITVAHRIWYTYQQTRARDLEEKLAREASANPVLTHQY